MAQPFDLFWCSPIERFAFLRDFHCRSLGVGTLRTKHRNSATNIKRVSLITDLARGLVERPAKRPGQRFRLLPSRDHAASAGLCTA